MSLKNPRLILGVLAVLAVVGIGGGFMYAKYKANPGQNQPPGVTTTSTAPIDQLLLDRDSRSPTVTSTGEIVDVGKGVELYVPQGWLYWKGQFFSYFNCGDPEGDMAYFCWKEILISDATTNEAAIMEYSGMSRYFVPTCVERDVNKCLNRKPEDNISHTDQYAYAYDVGELGVAVIAFPYKGKRVVTFASDEEPAEMYRFIRQYLR